jgi:maltose-binding protein MalE
VKRSAAIAIAVAAIALSGLSACSAKQTTNSLDNARPSGNVSASPTVSLPGIGTISYCVGQSADFAPDSQVTIAVYRGTDILGRKDAKVGDRVSIPVGAGSYDIVVNNIILQSGTVKDGQTVSGETGRFCPPK